MAEDPPDPYSTLALSTKVEEDFVSPLTALRGSLEILRDVPDLSLADRQRFVDLALDGCAHLERSVAQLSMTVYAAGQRDVQVATARPSNADYDKYAARLQIYEVLDIIEIDFSDFEFGNSKVVNAFYDVIDQSVAATGRSWYFLINYRNCRVWPEAWVAFAHRGKKANVAHSRGTVRYDEECDHPVPPDAADLSDRFNAGLLGSRDAALERIQLLKDAETA